MDVRERKDTITHGFSFNWPVNACPENKINKNMFTIIIRVNIY